jgi:hypothetical protein
MQKVAQRTCAACGKQQLQMLKCSRCKAAFYCDAACQRGHWRGAQGGVRGGGGGYVRRWRGRRIDVRCTR